MCDRGYTEYCRPRYVGLRRGGTLDRQHFQQGWDDWQKVAKRFSKDKPNAIVEMVVQEDTDLHTATINFGEAKNRTELLHNTLLQYYNFQVAFESKQANLPLNAEGKYSGFNNEDLPSDMLGYIAAYYGLPFDAVVQILGGGIDADWNPPSGFPEDCVVTSCGSGTARNLLPTMKVGTDNGNQNVNYDVAPPYNEFNSLNNLAQAQ